MDRSILAIILLLVYLFGLGSRGLNEPDEGRYASMALEVLEGHHNPLTPMLSDLGHFDKPPGIYWITAASLRFFGVNETAARLPSLLGGLLTLTGVFWAALRLRSREVAIRAVLIAATLPHIWACSRLLSPDMLLTAWTTLAIAAWAETRHRHGDLRFWALQVLFWTLAWYTKATPALIPLAALVLYALFSRDARDLHALRPLRLVGAMILLGLPWYLYQAAHNPELWDFFLRRELLGRVRGHVDGRHKFPGFQVVVVMAFWLPWWPLALRHLIRRPNPSKPTLVQAGPEILIVIIGLVVFSLISSQLPTYPLILAPWAAIAMARLIPSPLPVAAILSACFLFFLTTLLAPHLETRLGSNSSTRLPVQRLRELGATRIVTPRHLSGLEFYFGEAVTYIGVSPPLQVKTDSPNLLEHFAKPVLAPGTWVLSLKKDWHRLPEMGIQLPREGDYETIGDFRLFPLRVQPAS